ncbi:MAG: alpha/beta hydrolase [Clostridiales bacterium]|nr:alpha/beta hydrolase [Clostridiales bacterium]
MRKGAFILIGILAFAGAFAMGAASRTVLKPEGMKRYSVSWDNRIGTLKKDLSYGDCAAEKFDLYLPKDHARPAYGLVIYLHAGGFTSGDKSGDMSMLSWLCAKGYVAAGINYTLVTDQSRASVLSQSEEIRKAVPEVVRAAGEEGYRIDRMAAAGGSAGHTLAMLYAYRDGADAPVPVVLTFGAVGPSSFYAEDWGIFGVGTDTEEQREHGAALFSAMCGRVITPDEIADGSYLEKVKPIAASEWVGSHPVPTVVAYGTHDRLQPFSASKRLKEALEKNHADFRYFELTHSGHGLQNDDRIYLKWMETVEEYLDKYMPVRR